MMEDYAILDSRRVKTAETDIQLIGGRSLRDSNWLIAVGMLRMVRIQEALMASARQDLRRFGLGSEIFGYGSDISGLKTTCDRLRLVMGSISVSGSSDIPPDTLKLLTSKPGNNSFPQKCDSLLLALFLLGY